MAISAPGMGSNLDVAGIINQLMAVERQPLALLDRREADYQAKLSAYGTLKGALASLQSTMQGLADAARFQSVRASAADPSVLTATAGGTAAPGSYSVEVQQLAQQQKIRSDGFASPASVVGSGTLTLQYGEYDGDLGIFTPSGARAARTITIDPSTNTLAGVRDAINAADAGVAASIVHDGSSSRLVLTVKDTGAASSVRILVQDDDGTHLDTAGLSRLAFDPAAAAGAGKNLTQVQAAQDAKLRIDGIDVSRASNIVQDAIEGVTLNLLKNTAGDSITVSVVRDGAGIQASVESFVKSFNSINQILVNLSSYNTSTGKGAVLQGDAATLSIQRWLRTTVSAEVGAHGSLSQIGVSFQKDGSLALDAARLQSAVEADFDRIGSLFAARGNPTDSLIAYDGASGRTAAGDYAVTITQLATRGSLAGSQGAGLAITAGVNDQLGFNVDGVAVSITLAPGTYASADALAAEVQSRLNGAATLADAGISVTVSQSEGILTIASDRYGSGSGVVLSGGNGAPGLLGVNPISTQGVDVAGTINGVAAAGSGQTLTAPAGDAAADLRLVIQGGPPGARGSVGFSRGYADSLSRLAQDLLGDKGLIAARVDGLNASTKDIDRRQADFLRRLEATEARYRAQFTALDTMLSSLNQTSQFLQQQLAALPKIDS
ncbi:flagellar filament capping protein FliD [Nitrosovibrio sp. Nv17]|uniref:flagellar filament capping protein FliD n=1 Tax=Nitrosovibrio sp. Nv17 TaxID=1855339 RepID=UPI000908C6F0|nr:flagellar filament capping protein FliD [Nitrosovibrio sp. Nv17]SFW14609.1 flagellar hook-associated protein 2 [Nitrosovibrio sp. Nv17]